MFGLLAPAATPKDVMARLSAAMKDIMSMQEVKDALAAQGATAVYTTPDEAKVAIRDEVARWSKIIKDANIKPD
jgi:tripartite-type tricarboxylate transporter receptor subunit TctC